MFVREHCFALSTVPVSTSWTEKRGLIHRLADFLPSYCSSSDVVFHSLSVTESASLLREIGVCLQRASRVGGECAPWRGSSWDSRSGPSQLENQI
jgi:hypothetical protein